MSTATRPNQGALDVHGPYGSAMQPSSLRPSEGRILFHSEFGELSLPQYETMRQVLSDAQLSVKSAAMAQRSPNGAARAMGSVEGTFGPPIQTLFASWPVAASALNAVGEP